MKKKLNIFIFQPYPKFGGADRSIIRIINGNTNAKFTLISLTKCNYKKYLNKKINYIKLNANRTFYSIFELNKVVSRLIKNPKKNKNIFISNQNFANIITIFSLKNLNNLKTILIERNHLDELNNSKNFNDYIKKKIIFYLIKYTYKHANAVVGISKVLSEDLSKFIKKKVNIIYNPALDEKIYTKISDKITLSKNILKKKIILNVGFFEIQKDQITILKAFKLMQSKFKNVHLVLIGRGSLLKDLKNFVKSQNLTKKVSFLTTINNPSKYYKIADLFILSSKYEGFGNVIVEALKNKCPVITSNCKAGPMEIIDNGKFGDYFNVGDHKDLNKKINRFFKNNSKLKKKTMRSKIHLQKFNLKNNKLAFDKLFNNV